jgi:small conductance mechanosensitive channel
MATILENLPTLVVAYGLNILWAVIIFLIGRWAAGLIARLLRRTLTRTDVDPGLIGFAGNITYYAIVVFAALAALSRLGVQTTSIIAVLGAAGLAVGLALQGALANFAAGVLILLFKPFKVGDLVEVAGATGKVEELQIFTTVLTTPDNKTVIIPNGAVTGGNIINYTTKGTRRLDMVFGIGYDDDLLTAKRLLEQIVAGDERILQDPPPAVAVLELADSSVNFAVRPYVRVKDYWNVMFDITEQVKLTFDREGVSIPFPQQDVHIVQNDGMPKRT